MKRKLPTIIFVICSMSMCLSCKNEVSSTLKDMMSRPILLPDTSIFKKDYLLAVYIDSLECATCRLGHYSQYEYIMNSLDDYCDIGLIFIIDADQQEKRVISSIIDTNPQINVLFVDKSFELANSHIPKDPSYHTMLLNSSYYPVLVGDPISNTKIMSLYMTIVR